MSNANQEIASMCFWCGQDKEEKFKLSHVEEGTEVPKRLVFDYKPCNQCKELFGQGIQIIGTSHQPIVPTMFPIIKNEKETLYPTGTTFVAPEQWVKDFLKANNHEEMIESVLEQRILVLPDSFVSQMVQECKAPEMEVELSEEANNENS